jgi:dTDP-4-amino-4,6-dideoxygalactose transaminase
VHRNEPGTVFKWLHESIGTNWRMTEMQGALGRVALRKLPAWSQKRRRLAGLLDTCLESLPALRLVRPPAHVEHAYYKHYAFLRPEMLRPGWTRDRIVQSIQAEGIPCGSGICPEIYREKAFSTAEFCPARRLVHAQTLGETSLMFQVHPTLAPAHIDQTYRAVAKVLDVATRPAVSQRRAA